MATRDIERVLEQGGDAPVYGPNLRASCRRMEAAGWLRTWPPLPSAPLPTTQAVRRAFDLLLPVGHSFALVLYDEDEVTTGVALSRRRDGVDHVVGPERLLAWAGPLSGDYHRDHRALAHGVARLIAATPIPATTSMRRAQRAACSCSSPSVRHTSQHAPISV